MFVKRSEKRKDTVSSEENDYDELYASINFQVEFPTEKNQTLYIIGNIEELGAWDEERAEKLMKLDEQSNLWESTLPLECPVGMMIKYKYLIIDSNGNKIMETLPNNRERIITTKKAGQYIIMNKKGDFSTTTTFVGKDRRDINRKNSRINIDTLNMSTLTNGSRNENDQLIKNLKFNFGKPEDESEYISSLSPQDLISYENNISTFETYDKIPDFDYTQKITNSDRCILEWSKIFLILKKMKLIVLKTFFLQKIII